MPSVEASVMDLPLPPDRSAAIRAENVAGVAPSGNRVQWTFRNDSGTSASRSGVWSTDTGTRNALARPIRWVRSSARRHSRRK